MSTLLKTSLHENVGRVSTDLHLQRVHILVTTCVFRRFGSMLPYSLSIDDDDDDEVWNVAGWLGWSAGLSPRRSLAAVRGGELGLAERLRCRERTHDLRPSIGVRQVDQQHHQRELRIDRHSRAEPSRDSVVSVVSPALLDLHGSHKL